MPTSPIQKHLENIVQRQAAAKVQPGPGAVDKQVEPEQEVEGTAKAQPGMRVPPLQPNMLDESMAREAAIKFKRKKKRIRKACAALDEGKDPRAQASCGPSCVIL